MHNIRNDKPITQDRPFDPQQIPLQTQEFNRRLSTINVLTHISITFLQVYPMRRAAIQKSIWRGFRHSVWEVIDLHLHLSTAAKSQHLHYRLILCCTVTMFLYNLPFRNKVAMKRSNDRMFLLYYDIHPSVTDLGMDIFGNFSFPSSIGCKNK